MPYEYLDDGSTYDAGFEAWASNAAVLFRECWDAALGVMVDDQSSVRPTHRREIRGEAINLEMLLFDLLGELLYFKDADRTLYRIGEIAVESDPGGYRAIATLEGEPIDPARHDLGVDVKAVTLDQLGVKHDGEVYRARVILDT